MCKRREKMSTMIDAMKNIYHRFSGSLVGQIINRIYVDGSPIGLWQANRRVKRCVQKINALNKNSSISVMFVVQNMSVWNKQKPIFEAMLSNSRFSPVILAVPDEQEKNNNTAYEKLGKIYLEHCIDVRDASFDLRMNRPDYVFYARPYDQYLPVDLRSNIVSTFAKVCYVNYGYEFTQKLLYITYERKFFRNVYLFFAENSGLAEFNARRFRVMHKKKLRKSVFVGYPVFEDFMKRKPDMRMQDSKKTVIWTPRWSEDLSMGGSSFMEFKDQIADFAVGNKDVNLIFRPHPLAFNHFLSIGRITQEELDRYLNIYKENENMMYDNSSDYVEMFWNSDILLTDLSSVFVEYFLTGKPIIYCDKGTKFNVYSEPLYEGLYIVHSWSQAEKVLKDLLAGHDPLKEKRQQIIKQMFGEDIVNTSGRILDVIQRDYYGE